MGSVLSEATKNPGQTGMAVLWLLFTAGYFLFFYIFNDAREIGDASLDGYLEVVLLGVPPVVILAVIMWIREADIDPKLMSRVTQWSLAMTIVFMIAMYTATFVIETKFDFGERWLLLFLSAGMGVSTGAIMGTLKIRSIQRDRERRQSIKEAYEQRQERQQLECLNQYLRHEILNEIQKIKGHAGILLSDRSAEASGTDRLEIIYDSSTEIAEFIQSIRQILEANDHDLELVTIDVMEVLSEEVEQIRHQHADVKLNLFGPETAPILAGEQINRVFRNLIANAIEHNRRDVRIDIRVQRTDNEVEIKIRDYGSGIPEEKQDRLFDPPTAGDHGYGLFLTNNLVELYGGELILSNTDSSGTEFLIRIKAASDGGSIEPEISSPMPSESHGEPGRCQSN